MSDILITNPILVATHVCAALFGYIVHYLIICRWRHGHTQREIDWKQVISVGINAVVLTLFLAALVDSQFNEGPQPGLVFSIMAAWSFGSLAAERSFFTDILSVFARKK